MFKSTYLKLTFFYVLVVMMISVVFSVVFFRTSSDELGRGLGRQTTIIRNLPPNTRIQFPIGDIENARTQQLDESTSHLKSNLIYLNLLILIVSSAGSYFFARRSLKPIERMVESQNHFTADASHELKTPLTAMRSEIEVFLREKSITVAEAKKLFSSNLEEIGKLESLSNALLKLAKYDRAARYEFKTVSLSEAVAEAYEKVESLANEKSISFENELNEVKTQGDRQSLVELFVILIENAVKYSPAKSTISISVKQDDKHAVVSVKDQGIGIKASDIPLIFNRFYRADTSRCKEQCEGYGLGLSIAKRIVDLHKGTISVTSTQGKGSEFVVKL